MSEIIDIVEVGIPGPIGDVTPAALDARDAAELARDEAAEARDEAVIAAENSGNLVSATAETIPADQPASVVLSGPLNARNAHFRNPRGLPGVNAIDNDAAVAAYIMAQDSETSSALFHIVGEPDKESSTGFVTFAGTDPAVVPVVKQLGDGRAGVWEMVHNDSSGYLFHLLAGENIGHNAALLGIGVDTDGIGVLIPNKNRGRGIVGDQRATVTNTDAYWMHATQRSPGSPLVRLEMAADDAAALMQLIAFGSPGESQQLLYAGDPDGEAGRIRADNGMIDWRRNIRVRNSPDGEKPQYFEAATSLSANTTVARKSFHGASEDVFFGATGSPGVYYPHRISHASQLLSIQTAPNLAASDVSNPHPSEVSGWVSHIEVGHARGVTVGMAAGKVGFFGATPVIKPGNVPVTVAGIHAALIALGLIGA